jgi:hypothetical protein
MSVARVLAQLESHGAARATVVERGEAVGTLDLATRGIGRSARQRGDGCRGAARSGPRRGRSFLTGPTQFDYF